MDPSQTKSNLSFNKLRYFIRDDGPFDLRKLVFLFLAQGSRVGLTFPNGAELAIGVIGLLCHWCVLPINYSNTLTETIAELRNANIVAVIAHHDLPYLFNLMELSFVEKSFTILSATPDSWNLGIFSITQLTNLAHPKSTKEPNVLISDVGFHQGPVPPEEELPKNIRPDIFSKVVLLLFTSGTSGNKKLVPSYSLNMIVIGVGCIFSA